MKVLVCGGRDFTDRNRLFTRLDELKSSSFRPFSLIIHGACMIRGRLSGVDALAEEWAIHNELPYIGVPALWSAQGKGAGPIRNQLIVDSELIRPDICVAFPGGRGTADMVRRCMAAGISVLEG